MVRWDSLFCVCVCCTNYYLFEMRACYTIDWILILFNWVATVKAVVGWLDGLLAVLLCGFSLLRRSGML
jgi:hypothetical protein